MRFLVRNPAALLLAMAVGLGDGAAAATGRAAGELPAIDAGTRLLVVAPHPDDESLCCAGLMQRVLHEGGRVSVVWITSGDAAQLTLLLVEGSILKNPAKARSLGERRMAEARAASALLGVPVSGQYFLGYPDGGLLKLLGPEHRANAYTSPSTAVAAVPYRGALFPGHPYCGRSLEHDFTAVLEQVQPTLILAPSPLDSHEDHRAAGLLTIAVSTGRGMLPQVRLWIVHGGEGWPSPRGLVAGIPLTPAPLGRTQQSTPFALNPAEEDRKLLAVRAYDTQMQVMAPFLLSFVRTTELFSDSGLEEQRPAP